MSDFVGYHKSSLIPVIGGVAKYQFGISVTILSNISANQTLASTGIRWQRCWYMKNVIANYNLSGVITPYVAQADSSIRVRLILSCKPDALNVWIRNATLIYCMNDHNSDGQCDSVLCNRSVSPSGNEAFHCISIELNETTYNVSVRVVVDDIQTVTVYSAEHRICVDATSVNGLHSLITVVVVIAVGTIAVIILMVLGRRRWQKLNEWLRLKQRHPDDMANGGQIGETETIADYRVKVWRTVPEPASSDEESH
jgi:hypothetical protein